MRVACVSTTTSSTEAASFRRIPRRAPRLRSSEHRLLLIAGDVTAAAAAVLVALGTWTITAGEPFDVGFIRAHLTWFLAVPAWIALLAPGYGGHAFSLRGTLRNLRRAAAVAMIGYLVVYFYAPRQALPRIMALSVIWEACLLTLAWRLLYVFTFTRMPMRRRVVIVGIGAAGRAIHDVIRQSAPHMAVVAFADDEPNRQPSSVAGVSVTAGQALPDLIREQQISEVILAHSGPARGELLQALVDCQQYGVDVVRMSTVYEELVRRVPVQHLDTDWVFSSLGDAIRSRNPSAVAKRAVDLAGGAIGSLAFVLLAPVIAAAIWIDSGGPILYRQRRTGRGGREFELIKFRTMVVDAEREGPRWAESGDPRATRVGRVLRRARLDELPQFVNVLRGDMSLVGPRPERPEFVALLEPRIPFYRMRLIVRPGLTGWAQINCPYGDSAEAAALKLEHDLYYVKYRSVPFDAWIILRTIVTMAQLRGT